MNATECMDRSLELQEFLETASAVAIESLDALGNGLYAIEGKVALPCWPAGRYGEGRNNSGNPILDIPVSIDDEEIGFLCLTSKLRDSGIELSAVTDAQRHAIIKILPADAFDAGGRAALNLSMDCIVIGREHVEMVLRHRDTSALWGGFVLEPDALPLEKCVAPADGAKIVLAELSSPRTDRHRAALQRATESPIVVDRLLHLYHFLELDYDHEIVNRIRGINLENTRGLEKLLNTGRTELDRLLLVTEDLTQIEEIERVAGRLKNHKDTALAVFYEYGKEHNPLKEQLAFERQFIDPPTVNREELDDIKRLHGLKLDFAKSEASYREMLVRLACYWIYRIRCCIAHNKLGEYHLRTPSDMRFAAEFGEPLVCALIRHRLRMST